MFFSISMWRWCFIPVILFLTSPVILFFDIFLDLVSIIVFFDWCLLLHVFQWLVLSLGIQSQQFLRILIFQELPSLVAGKAVFFLTSEHLGNATKLFMIWIVSSSNLFKKFKYIYFLHKFWILAFSFCEKFWK